jgi:hypothetical protein
MYSLKYECNPNNETRVVLYRTAQKSRAFRDLAADLLGVTPDSVVEKITTCEERDRKNPPLDIRSEFKTVAQAHSYARTSFGIDAARRIMRAGGALDRHDSESTNYLFLTATLPGDDDWSKWAIAEYSSYIINCLKAWLSKRLNNRMEFYVWEHQKRAALHLHYCIHVPDPAIRAWIKKRFRFEWVRLLNAIEQMSGVNMWGKWAEKPLRYKTAILQTQVQNVRKSVAAYMAGYCAGAESKHGGDHKKPWYPKRWFGVSRPLSDLIKQHTKEEVAHYPSYAIAKNKLDEIAHNNEAEAVLVRNYRHSVGRGETNVTYHTPEIQEQLWLSRKTMKYQATTHPNATYFIRLLARIQQTFSVLETSLQPYKDSSIKQYLEPLRDGLYLDSLRRGTLRDCQVKAVEILFLHLPCQSSLRPSQRPLLIDVQKFCLIHSQAFSQIRYNNHGWMSQPQDLQLNWSEIKKLSYAGTSSDEGVTPASDGIATRAIALKGTDSDAIQLPLTE